MTQQDAIQFLISEGYDESAAIALVASLPTTPGDFVNPEALEAAVQADAETPPPSGSGGSFFERILSFVNNLRGGAEALTGAATRLPRTTEQQAEKVAEVEAEGNALLVSGLEKQSSTDPEVQASITDEEQAEIDKADPNTRADVLAFIQSEAFGDDLNRYDWVYQALTVGSLDDNESLIRFYEFYTKLKKPPELLTDEDEIVAEAKDILSRGSQNRLVQIAVMSFGKATGNYIPTQTFDNVNALEIADMMERYNITFDRALEIGHVSQEYDLEPLELAELWDNFDVEKLVGGPPSDIFEEKRDIRALQGGLADVAQLFNTGLTLYDQSFLLASIHVQNPELAQRFRSDPYSLDAGELREALDTVDGGRGREGDAQIAWIQQRLAGGFRASAQVDKEAMRNAVQVLADGWNLTGTEGVVANLTAELVSQAIAGAEATLPNPFGPLAKGVALTDVIQDRAAHVKRRLRETPEYKDLFQNLQGGESEEEFVRRFENRSQAILGDDVVGAVRNAMRTGNVNTIFQQGLNTPVGDSSTRFQEIIAKNAQVFRDLL